MEYEEKRELRKQISQLLADAGLNQAVIKEMVKEEIHNKVERSVQQALSSLNAEHGGNYLQYQAKCHLDNKWQKQRAFVQAFKEILEQKDISIDIKDAAVEV